jgi:hypothetical protein
MAGPGTVALSGALLFVTLLAGPAHPDDLADRMDGLVARHPDVASVEVLGSSASGKELRALVLALGERPLAERQGLLVVAGLDGRRHSDGELVLAAAEWLLDGPGDDAASGSDAVDLAQRLGDKILVLVPVADPEGAAATSGEFGAIRALPGNRRPDDADRDGRIDEDGPNDLDGDGLITWMRVPDGAGEWLIDEHDPRALRKAEDDERGTHRLLREGLDDDGDGAFDEDGGEGVQIDRNFAHGFKEHTATGGTHPLSEPETKALVDFLLGHPGLTSVVVVGEDDTLVSAPSKARSVDRGGFGGFRDPLDGLLEDDIESLAIITELFEQAADGKHDVKSSGPADGSLLAWAYHQAGRWPLGLRTWAPPEDFPGDDKKDDDKKDDDKKDGDKKDGDGGESDSDEGDADAGDADAGDADDEGDADEGDESDADGDEETEDADEPTSDPESPVPAAVLAWLDAERDGEGFVPWKAYDHPDLGPIEIGGLHPTLLVDPPSEAVEALTGRLAAFLLAVLDAGPVLAFEDVELTPHGNGLVTVELALVNTGRLPTAPRFGADARIVRPARVSLQLPAGVQRVGGPAQILVNRLEGLGGRRELRWVLSGVTKGASITVIVDTDTTADLELELTLP